MKKLVLSIVIASMTLSLVGCGTKSKAQLEEINRKLENSYETINKLEEQVNELSNRLQQQTNELSNRIYDCDNVELGYYNKNDGVVEIGIGYLPDNYQERYEELIQELESEGKTVIAPEEAYGQRVFIIEAKETLRNITYSDICDDFMYAGCEVDIEKSIMKHGLSNNGNLAKKLEPGETLVFAVHESEGIPMGYFYWTEESGKIVYKSVVFDGSGRSYTDY